MFLNASNTNLNLHRMVIQFTLWVIILFGQSGRELPKQSFNLSAEIPTQCWVCSHPAPSRTLVLLSASGKYIVGGRGFQTEEEDLEYNSQAYKLDLIRHVRFNAGCIPWPLFDLTKDNDGGHGKEEEESFV